MTDGELAQHTQQEHHGNGSGQARTGAHLSPDLNDGDRHDFHLLVADVGITDGYEVYQIWVALCGTRLRGKELPSSTCPEDCGCEITYCLDCLRAANERNFDAGVHVDCPPGVQVLGFRDSGPRSWAWVPGA